MYLRYVYLAAALASVGASVDQGDNSSLGQGGGSSGGTGSTVGNVNSSDGGPTVYLSASDLQTQLLNTTGIEPDSLVAVSANYSALQENSPGLGNVTAPNTNVFASILIVPDMKNDSTATSSQTGGSFESTAAAGLSGRTQLMYNCTSAPNLWNLLEDPNVLQLEKFQQLPPVVANDNSTAGEGVNASEEQRAVVAIALIKVANCAIAENSSVGRPVLGNSFFKADFDNSEMYFYTLNATIVATVDTVTTSPAQTCVLELQMTRANLTEVYPNCRIRFHSTDLNNLGGSGATSTSSLSQPSGEGAASHRRLDASSFGFLKNPSCVRECGDYDLDPDQCGVYLGKVLGVDKWKTAQCTIQFYAKNSGCNNECGDKVGFPHDEDPLPANQCYHCYETLKW
jgi:hypothetical protein